MGLLLQPEDDRAPRYWRYETSGVLAPVVTAYIQGRELTEAEVGVMRAYLRQWILAPVWAGDSELRALRENVERIRTRRDIDAWLMAALDEGHDPL
jgi:hypothetical protein